MGPIRICVENTLLIGQEMPLPLNFDNSYPRGYIMKHSICIANTPDLPHVPQRLDRVSNAYTEVVYTQPCYLKNTRAMSRPLMDSETRLTNVNSYVSYLAGV
jgi:hypothetical protein